MTIYWVNQSGKIKKATADNGLGPNGHSAILVPPHPQPSSGKQKWDFVTETWSTLPPSKPKLTERLTALKGSGASVDNLIDAILG